MLHDGACPLCAREVAHYRALDRAGLIDFVDVSQAAPRMDLPGGVTPDLALKRLHVVLADGRVVSGARAFVALWRVLPGWRRIAPVAALPGVIHLLELGYRAWLPVRPLLARLARLAADASPK